MIHQIYTYISFFKKIRLNGFGYISEYTNIAIQMSMYICPHTRRANTCVNVNVYPGSLFQDIFMCLYTLYVFVCAYAYFTYICISVYLCTNVLYTSLPMRNKS